MFMVPIGYGFHHRFPKLQVIVPAIVNHVHGLPLNPDRDYLDVKRRHLLTVV
jgi:hypothetical protein